MEMSTPGKVNISNNGVVNMSALGKINVFGVNSMLSGTSGEVQYNNAGSLGGATGVVSLDGISITLLNTIPLIFGTGDDLILVSSGANLDVTSTTGDINIDSLNGDLVFRLGQLNGTTQWAIKDSTSIDLFTCDDTGNISMNNNMNASQRLISSAVGQYSQAFYTNSFTGAVLINSSTYTDIVPSFGFTPLFTNSKIKISIDCEYVVTTTGADTFEVQILVDGLQIANKLQFWTNGAGGGTRGGIICPISGTYENTTLSLKLIQIQCRRVSGDANCLFTRDGSCSVFVEEIVN